MTMRGADLGGRPLPPHPFSRPRTRLRCAPRRTFAGSPARCADKGHRCALAMLACSPRVRGCAWHALYPAPLAFPAPATKSLPLVDLPACLLTKAGRSKNCVGRVADAVPVLRPTSTGASADGIHTSPQRDAAGASLARSPVSTSAGPFSASARIGREFAGLRVTTPYAAIATVSASFSFDSGPMRSPKDLCGP